MPNFIGNNIRLLRQKEGLTQKQLASIFNISNSTLSQYETGDRTPSDDIKVRISKYFNVSIDFLLGIDIIISNKQTNLVKKQNELLHITQFLTIEEVDKVIDYAKLITKSRNAK